jgi:chromate transporter
VVIGIFGAAVYRLGKSTLKTPVQIAICMAAAVLAAITLVGIATTLLLGACAGIAIYHSRRQGIVAALVVAGLSAVLYLLPSPLPGPQAANVAAGSDSARPALWHLAGFFLKVSALTFGGGIAIVAFVQEHVVNQMQWLTAREFIDGLALGQLTPGPTLMIAAYVGYTVAGFAGALVGALCIFAPAFFLLLPLMPVLDRFEHLLWVKAAMRGITPAVIGCLVVTLAQLLPHAAPDLFGWALVALSGLASVVWRAQPLPLVIAAAVLGVLRGFV